MSIDKNVDKSIEMTAVNAVDTKVTILRVSNDTYLTTTSKVRTNKKLSICHLNTEIYNFK